MGDREDTDILKKFTKTEMQCVTANWKLLKPNWELWRGGHQEGAKRKDTELLRPEPGSRTAKRLEVGGRRPHRSLGSFSNSKTECYILKVTCYPSKRGRS